MGLMLCKGYAGDESKIMIANKMSHKERCMWSSIIDVDNKRCLKHRYANRSEFESKPEFKQIIQKAKELYEVME